MLHLITLADVLSKLIQVVDFTHWIEQVAVSHQTSVVQVIIVFQFATYVTNQLESTVATDVSELAQVTFLFVALFGVIVGVNCKSHQDHTYQELLFKVIQVGEIQQ